MDLLNAEILSNWFVVLVLNILVVAVIIFYLQRQNDLPPGPWGLPLLGYLPFLGNKPFLALAELAKKYGPIFSVRLGTRLVIVLGDYDVIKEAFVVRAKHFSSRPLNNGFADAMDYQFTGYYGQDWIEMKKIMSKCLKELGTGTAKVEVQILDEIGTFLRALRRKISDFGEVPVTIRHELGVSAANTTCVLTFGRRFDYEDVAFKDMKDSEDEITLLYDSVSWRFLFPFLVRIARVTGNSIKSPLREKGDIFKCFAKDVIQDHLTNPKRYRDQDFIFDFLKEQENRKRQQIPVYPFDDEHLYGTLMALFGGGSQTVENTINWAIVYMLHYPELQKRVHLELDQVIGREKQVAYSDRQRTPLAEATLMEIERYVSMLPINVAHSNSEEVMLRGYRIPKDSYILANFWGVHHDVKKWIEPEKFNPDRFLVGGKAVRPENLIPFSIGKRSCPGESLAKMELYLYFVSMLQHFQFVPVEGEPLPCLPLEIDYPGLVYRCPEYRVRMIPRF